MIKRWYSISARKNHKDGSGSYAFSNRLFCRKSWFPEHGDALNTVIEDIKSSMDDVDDETVLEIISFNRL